MSAQLNTGQIVFPPNIIQLQTRSPTSTPCILVGDILGPGNRYPKVEEKQNL